MSFKDSLSQINKKQVLVGLVTIIFLTIFLLFAPFLWAGSTAEGSFDQVEKDKTELVIFDILNPQYAVFQKKDNYDATVNFVNLHRKWLVLWEAEPISEVTFSVPENLTDEEKAKLQDQNLDALVDGVKSGKITAETPNPEPGLDDLTQKILDERSRDRQPGKEISYLEDNTQTYKVSIINGLNYPENNVLLNGEKIENLKNVFSLSFEQNDNPAEFLYFTDFEVFEEVQEIQGSLEDGYGTVQFSGDLKRYSIETGEIETIYEGDYGILTLRANQEKLLFFNEGGVGGVLDLETKEILNISFPLLEENLPENSVTNSVQVLDIGDSTGVVNWFGFNGENEEVKSFRIYLEDGKVEEITE